MVRFITGCVLVVFAIPAFGHGGGIDRCGGHNDRRHGGYHVHQMGKYCACNPSASQCKKAPAEKKRKAK